MLTYKIKRDLSFIIFLKDYTVLHFFEKKLYYILGNKSYFGIIKSF